MQERVLHLIASELEIREQPETDIRIRIEEHIRHLILNDMQKLISLLYRLDVNENKIKHALENNQQHDAALILTELIIDRQAQKILTRDKFGKSNTSENISEDEKW